MTARSLLELLEDTGLLEDKDLPLLADVRFRDEELPALVPDCDITSERDREPGVETVPFVLVRELPAAATPVEVTPVPETPEDVVLLRVWLSIAAPVVVVLPRDEPVVADDPVVADERLVSLSPLLLAEPDASVLALDLPDVVLSSVLERDLESMLPRSFAYVRVLLASERVFPVVRMRVPERDVVR